METRSSNEMGTPRSWLALGAGVLGALALLDLVLGPALSFSELVRPMTGFTIFGLGLLEGVLALALGVLGWLRTRGGVRRGRPLALLGLAAGVVALGIGLRAAAPGQGLPRINDITTNPGDPPAFPAASRAEPNRGRDMGYPAGFAPLTTAAYPDLRPLEVAGDARTAYARALETARALGWEIVEERPQRGEFEAREVSSLFRFVDDVSVRVRAAEGGAVIDLRSKSRDGRGDLGANAARIRAFRDALDPG